MTDIIKPEDQYFTTFEDSVDDSILPDHFSLVNENRPHLLCLMAAKELQSYLGTQTEWAHNFGLLKTGTGTVIGKMFGVLVVKNKNKETGYLAAFSGKLAGGNHHSRFVPPVFDSLTENSFLNRGMAELTGITKLIRELEALKPDNYKQEISFLKTQRKMLSVSLQSKLFDNYHFLNQAGEEKSLNEIFKKALYKNPPSGAGECAGPKLLQYAFRNEMKPIAIAEFWWGLSPKSDFWKHGQYYPCCREKCEPILEHMLKGIL